MSMTGWIDDLHRNIFFSSEYVYPCDDNYIILMDFTTFEIVE